MGIRLYNRFIEPEMSGCNLSSLISSFQLLAIASAPHICYAQGHRYHLQQAEQSTVHLQERKDELDIERFGDARPGGVARRLRVLGQSIWVC